VIRAAAIAIAALGAVPTGSALAASDEAGAKPFEIVRELQDFQNKAVLEATTESQAEQHERISKIAARLTSFRNGVWKDPKNARAAVLYVLSGGDPRVLRRLLGAQVKLGVDEKLAKAAVAYGEHRDAEAIELFDGLDMSLIDRSIVGQVALVRALLVADKEPAKAIALLDIARISSSGTIVEEAALRREAILVAKADNLDMFESLSSQYFRRFSTSTFAQAFQSQFAKVALGNYAHDSDRLAKLESLLGGLQDTVRREICLSIAEEGIASANIELVRFAARVAAIDPKSKPDDAARLKLFEAAASIVTKDGEAGLAALSSIDRSTLGAREEALLNAALAVSREVRRPPPPASGAGPPADDGNDMAGEAQVPAGPSVVVQANEAIARADKLLSEAIR
jgi:chemotaxis protein MotC